MRSTSRASHRPDMSGGSSACPPTPDDGDRSRWRVVRGNRSCRPRNRPRRRRACDAARRPKPQRMVPPANHGRRRRASASRRTTSDPIPVGYPNSLYQEMATKSGCQRDRSRLFVGENADASSSTSQPRSLRRAHPVERMADARVIRLGRVCEEIVPACRSTIECFEHVVRVMTQVRRVQWARTRHRPPAHRANSRMPLTELWLSAVSRNWLPAVNGYDSPTSLSAPLALAVKTTVYSSGEALKNAKTARRACSARLGGQARGRAVRMRVAEDPVPEQRLMLPELRLGIQPATGVVEVDVILSIEPGRTPGPAALRRRLRRRRGRVR